MVPVGIGSSVDSDVKSSCVASTDWADCNNGPKLLKMNRMTNPIASGARRIAPRRGPLMLDLSRPCSVAPFNNQGRPREVGVPLCSGPSSLVLVQGTEVRILPGLPLFGNCLEFGEIEILFLVFLGL